MATRHVAVTTIEVAPTGRLLVLEAFGNAPPVEEATPLRCCARSSYSGCNCCVNSTPVSIDDKSVSKYTWWVMR